MTYFFTLADSINVTSKTLILFAVLKELFSKRVMTLDQEHLDLFQNIFRFC